MNDMSAVIVPKSDQINADDFIAGPQTITIRDVQIRGGQEQPVSIFFEGSDKAFRPCKSMSRVLVGAWGPDAKLYVGRSLTLYRDPSVKWGGLEVGGIRISHMSDIDGKMQMQLTATRGQRKPHVVLPLVMGAASADGLSLADAETSLRSATSLDDLKTAWSRKSMAPHRAALQDVLDECKAALDFEIATDQPSTAGPEVTGDADPQHEADVEAASAGEQTTLESAKAEIDAAELKVDIDNRVTALAPLLDDGDADELRSYAMEKIGALANG